MLTNKDIEVLRQRLRSLIASRLRLRDYGRSGRAALRAAGGVKPRRVLFVTHQTSRTGAPLLALSLCRSLSRRFDLVTLTLMEGELDAEFAALGGPFHIVPDKFDFGRFLDTIVLAYQDIDAVVVNTLACGDAVAECAARDLPVLLFVHDFTSHFTPVQVARSLLHCETVIYPSAVVRDDSLRAASETGLTLRPDFPLIRHQGRISPAETPDPETLARLEAFIASHSGASRPLVIMAAGNAQTRKGTGHFVDALAHALRRRPDANLVFVWVGGGFEKAERGELLIFLKAQIARQPGVAERLLLLGETTEFNAVLERADGFILSSLLDPFPNVAIDALCKGVPLVCFEGATGIADLAGPFPDLVSVVPYRDAAALGEWTLNLLETRGATRPAARDDVVRYFDPGPYEEFVNSQLDELRRGRKAAAPALDLEHARHLVDSRFVCGKPNVRQTEANVLRTLRKLQARSAPAPVPVLSSPLRGGVGGGGGAGTSETVPSAPPPPSIPPRKGEGGAPSTTDPIERKWH